MSYIGKWCKAWTREPCKWMEILQIYYPTQQNAENLNILLAYVQFEVHNIPRLKHKELG